MISFSSNLVIILSSQLWNCEDAMFLMSLLFTGHETHSVCRWTLILPQRIGKNSRSMAAALGIGLNVYLSNSVMRKCDNISLIFPSMFLFWRKLSGLQVMK
jgi:hypothetical protein